LERLINKKVSIFVGVALAKPCVTLRFDDAHADHYTKVVPILKEYNAKGVFAVPTSRIGASPSWLSLDQLKEMQTMGHEIVSHSVTHPHLPELTDEQCEWEIRESQRWLREHGFPANFFVPPFHYVLDREIKLIMKYYWGVPIWEIGYNKQPVPRQPTERLYLHDPVIDYGTYIFWSWDQIKLWLDSTIEHEYYLPIVWHHFEDPDQTSVYLLRKTVEYCHDNGIQFVTLSEMLLPSPPPPPNIWDQFVYATIAGALVSAGFAYFFKGFRDRLKEEISKAIG
jgi:peptidoglycan/xylan/chitin deacetylase (PgdA/CDA1 family)